MRKGTCSDGWLGNTFRGRLKTPDTVYRNGHRSFHDPESHSPGLMGWELPSREAPSARYYEQVEIILVGGRSESGSLIGSGPGLRGLPRTRLPRTQVNSRSCKLALTDLGSNPPSIACRVFHPGAAVRIAFPLFRLLDGETTGVEGPPV